MPVQAIDILHTILQWVVAPVAAFVWFLYREVQGHETDIAVLKAQTETNKQAHDREMKEIRDTTLDADGKPIWWNGTAWIDATGLVV